MRLIVGMACLMIASPALAQGQVKLPDNKCLTDAGRGATAERLTKAVEKLTSTIESVPPADSEWLRNEMGQAVTQQNAGKMRLVMQHRYYRADNVHEAADRLTQSLRKAGAFPSLQRQAIELNIAIRDSYDLRTAISEYIDFDANRSPRVIAADKVSDVTLNAAYIAGATSLLLSCTVRLIPPSLQAEWGK